MAGTNNNLILVKHSLPEMVPGTPANQWQLSAEGRERCNWLGEKLAGYHPNAFYSSLEPKALETAALAAAKLGMENTPRPDLHEHLRQTVGYMQSNAEFQAAVADFFARPDELVFGEESANQARERFTAALNAVLREHSNQNIVIVAHGTVISLFTAQYNPIDIFSFWSALTLPSFIVLTRPILELAGTVAYPQQDS